MKKALLIILIALLSGMLFAQIPEKISYQAVIRNTSEELIPNTSIGMQISILMGESPSVASPIYVERHFPTTNNNGLITIEIGGVDATVVSGVFGDIDWSAGIYFIKTETDVNGGSNYTITGTSQLLSVPYALHAKTAENTFSGNYNDLKNAPTIPSIPSDISHFNNDAGYITDYAETDPVFASSEASEINGDDILNLGNLSGKNTGDQDLSHLASQGALEDTASALRSDMLTQDMGDERLTNLADPIDDKDAVTKSYVTLSVSSSGDTLFLGANQFVIIPGISVQNIDPNGVVFDGDGNEYQYVVIGTQLWLNENLKTTKYNDGSNIPRVISNNDWSNLSSPGYCWYNNDETNKETYGALYNWYTVSTEKLCPTGWHVPSDTDWNILVEFLGGASVAGGKLKETGTEHWKSPNGFATNEVGFWALPAGYRVYSGSFYSFSIYAGFWSSNEPNNLTGRWWYISSDYGNISNDDSDSKVNGFSVRCIRD